MRLDSLPSARTLEDAAELVRAKLGRQLLCGEEILVLAGAEIAHTFTRDEMGYASTGELGENPAQDRSRASRPPNEVTR